MIDLSLMHHMSEWRAKCLLVEAIEELQQQVKALNDHREERCDCTKEMDQEGLNSKQKENFKWLGNRVTYDGIFIDD